MRVEFAFSLLNNVAWLLPVDIRVAIFPVNLIWYCYLEYNKELSLIATGTIYYLKLKTKYDLEPPM